MMSEVLQAHTVLSGAGQVVQKMGLAREKMA